MNALYSPKPTWWILELNESHLFSGAKNHAGTFFSKSMPSVLYLKPPR